MNIQQVEGFAEEVELKMIDFKDCGSGLFFMIHEIRKKIGVCHWCI